MTNVDPFLYRDFMVPVTAGFDFFANIATGTKIYLPLYVMPPSPTAPEKEKRVFCDGCQFWLTLTAGAVDTSTARLVAVTAGDVGIAASSPTLTAISATLQLVENTTQAITPSTTAIETNLIPAGSILCLEIANGSGVNITGHCTCTAWIRSGGGM